MGVGPLSVAGVGLVLVSLVPATPSVFVPLESCYSFGARLARALLLLACLSSLGVLFVPTPYSLAPELLLARQRRDVASRGWARMHCWRGLLCGAGSQRAGSYAEGRTRSGRVEVVLLPM